MNTSQVVPYYFQSHEIRTITDEHTEPWFVAKDVCDALDLENVTKSLYSLCEDELTLQKVRSGGQDREVNIISESGLYRLIFRSNKPEAEVFRKWVFSEVLPAIRKTGQYSFSDDNDFFAPATDGPATVSIPRLEEAARGVKAAMIMARAYGWKNEDARQYANNLIKDITGIDTLALLNIPDGHVASAPLIGNHRTELTRIVGEYLEERCDLEAAGRVSATAIYADFCSWFPEHHFGELPTQAIFGAIMANYRRKIKSGGFVFYSGLAIRAMEVTQ